MTCKDEKEWGDRRKKERRKEGNQVSSFKIKNTDAYSNLLKREYPGGWLSGWQEKGQSNKDSTDTRLHSGRRKWLEKPVELNEKTTELVPLLVNKGGAVLHCALWKGAGRAVSLSTRSVHTPWLVPTGPTHRPVIMWLSALFRTVCCFRAWPSSSDWRDHALCSSRTTKSGTATGYVLSVLLCKRDAAWCGRKGTGLDGRRCPAPSQMRR